MNETLLGVSPSRSKDMVEEPTLVQAAVATLRPSQPAAIEVVDAAGPSAEELVIARELVRWARLVGSR